MGVDGYGVCCIVAWNAVLATGASSWAASWGL